MRSILLFSYVLTIIVAVSSENYCAMKCKHIACGHSNHFDRRNCPSNAKLITIPNSSKRLIVDAHNKKRNFIAGGGDANHRPACRMAVMRWDNELAKLAALNVMQCRMEHDHCHNTNAFKYSGQNLFEQSKEPAGGFNNAAMLNIGIQSWYNEVKYSRQYIMDSYPANYKGPQIGHFTVMMADRNTHVGCAAATYTRGRKSFFLFACNYATTNMIGKPIYSKCKSPATSCSSGRNSRYPNLCSDSERYQVNKWF